MKRKPTFDWESLWKEVEARRAWDALTYRAAAQQIGVNLSTLWRIKIRPASVETLVKVCAWLKVPMDSFVK
jgi:hypothetical protein